MGERIFSKYQYGPEATRGTIVPATKILIGAEQKPIPMDWKPVYPADNLGVRIESGRSLKSELFVEDSIGIPHAYFQVLPFFFKHGLKGGVTAAPVTANQTDYLWTFSPTLNAANNPNTFTLEAGDDMQAYVREYCMFKDIKISGEIAQDGSESPIKIEANYFARQVAKQNFTASLVAAAVTSMSAKKTRLYDDSTWAAAGNTEVTATLRGFELEILNGNHPKFFGDANLYFSSYGEGFVQAMLTLTLEGNAAAGVIYDECDAQTFRAIQLKMLGDAIVNTNSTHALTTNIWGQWEKVVPLNAESQNNNLHQALFHGLISTDLANALAVTVVTNTNTV